MAKTVERLVLSAELTAACRELQETDRFLRTLLERRMANGVTSPLDEATYREVWIKRRGLKDRVFVDLLAELEVKPGP